MAKKRSSGAEWAAAAGHKAVGLTLPPDQLQELRVLAAKIGLSRAGLARALVRWAIGIGDTRLKKILGKSLDSQESVE